MRININTIFYITFFVFLFCACNHKQSQQAVLTLNTDSLKQDSAKKARSTILRINELLDNTASNISGIRPKSPFDSALTNNKNWLAFSTNLNENWKRHDSTHLQPMQNWSDNELKEMKNSSDAIFYPFSGPDILNAYTFFPQAKIFYMIGREPVGTIPKFDKSIQVSDVNTYFPSLQNSLSSILNFSFFRTKSMSVDFHKEDLNGTIHLILLFLKRMNNSIIDINYVRIDENGMLSILNQESSKRLDTIVNHGVEITFVDKDSLPKKVYYFSIDVSDGKLSKNNGFNLFIKKTGSFNTYLKSASYLMHESNFSTIRELILTQSKFILQDDSGIPYRYFPDTAWNVSLYGKYVKPISLFANKYQDDLRKAYMDTASIKPLSFGIGYQYKQGESMMMLLEKK